MTELDTVAPAGPSRRAVLKTAAWSAPVVAMTVATPLAAATTITGNVRITIPGVDGTRDYEPIPLDEETFGATYGLLYDAPGNGAAPVGTLDRETHDRWLQIVDEYATTYSGYAEAGGYNLVRPYTSNLVRSVVSRQGPTAIPAGTTVQALYSAPGFQVTASSSLGTAAAAGNSALVTRTLPTAPTAGASLLGNVTLNLTSLSSTFAVSLGALDVAYNSGVAQTYVPLTGQVIQPSSDSNPADNVATYDVATSYEAFWGLREAARRLLDLVREHNYKVENGPAWWGYPETDATLIPVAPLEARVIVEGDLVPVV